MSFQTRKTFVHLRNTNLDNFDEFWELSVPRQQESYHDQGPEM